MKKIISLSLFFPTLLFTNAYAFDKECQALPSQICHLSGRLEAQSFPGPPNYENIKTGDKDEKGLYLRLDNPVIIHYIEDGKTKSESTSLVHLTGKIKKKLFKQAHSKNHVVASGTLFEGFNAHHHTHFLMDVNKFSENKK